MHLARVCQNYMAYTATMDAYISVIFTLPIDSTKSSLEYEH